MLSFDLQTALNNVSSPWCSMGTSNSTHVKLYSLSPTTKTCAVVFFFFLSYYILSNVNIIYSKNHNQKSRTCLSFLLFISYIQILIDSKNRKNTPLHIKFPLFKISFIFQWDYCSNLLTNFPISNLTVPLSKISQYCYQSIA